VCSPSGDSMYTLLNKPRLSVAAAEAGLAVPTQWLPANAQALGVEAGHEPPFIIKPQTHVGYQHWRKGTVVQRSEHLASAYSRFSIEGSYDPQVLAHDPAVGRPFIQQFDPAAHSRIYNLTGFIGRDPGVAAFRATNKVLQYPRRVGMGLCFESAPVVPEVRDGVLRMCRAIGFHGLFEAEFIPGEGEYKLIDFNPRYFNSMGFDVARGFPLPWLAYLDAIGDEATLHGALATAEQISLDQEPVNAWSHRTLLPVMLLGQRLTRGMSRSEVRAWRRWQRRRVLGDFVRSADDPWPGRLGPLLDAGAAIRRPRDFTAKFLRH
jgi:D-aspartate ligase